MNAPPKPLAPGARTQDWGRFLGPRGDGRCDEAPIRPSLGPGGPPKVWETPKGEGYAPPSVVAGRVYLFHRIGGRETLTCLDAESGKVLWNQGHPVAYQDRYGYDGGPRCQPVGDARRMATLGVAGALTGWDSASGKVLWRRDLLREFAGGTGFFGVGATPWMEGGRLHVAVSAREGGRLLALDVDTGRTLWETPTAWGAGYAALVAGRVHGRRFLFAFLGGDDRPPTGGLLCVDPDSGRILGKFPWRARRYESVNASAPLVVGNQVLITECYGAGTALCDVSPEGVLTPRWTTREYGAHFMTPAVRDGHIYLVDGHGPYNAPLVCADLATGAVRWRAEPEWPLVVKEGGRTVSVP
ncbi:MAG: PQQ-binding-like beta-propeller repeat protein, partial [Armatimonadota bacterium]